MNTAQLIEKVRKPILIIVGLVVLYSLAGFILLPKFMQSKLPELVASETGRHVSIERIEFNPFSLELSLQGFVMQENDLQTFVSFDEFFANLQVWSSLWNLALVLDELRLSTPYVRLEMLKNDRYNFSDLLTEDEAEEAEQSSDIFPVIINKIKLEQGEVETVNSKSTEPVNKVISNINFKLDHFSTLRDADADLGFSLAVNGDGRLTWQGDFGVNPILSKGEVNIEGLQYADLWKLFLQDSVQFKWIAGSQSIAFNYELSYPEEELFLKLTQGRLVTKDLTFASKENDRVFLSIPNLVVDDIVFDLNRQSIDIAKIETNNTGAQLWYGANGQLNFQSVFATQETGIKQQETKIEKQDSVNSAPPKPWVLDIHEVTVNSSSINYSDNRTNQDILLNVSAVDLGLKDNHFQLEQQLQITANAGYINLHELVLNAQKNSEIIKLPIFQVSGIDLNLQEKNIRIQSVNSSNAVIKSSLEKNGELNFQSLFAPKAQQQQTTAKQGAEPVKSESNENPWLVQLEAFKIDNYTLQFTDFTLETPAELYLSGLNFSVADFNNKPGTRLPLSLSSRLNKKGQINLSGYAVVDPFKADLDVTVKQLGIQSFEPYIQKNARLDIVKGDINTKGKLAVSQDKQTDLELQYQGNVNVNELHTRDQILKQDFIKWQKLQLGGLDFNLHKSQLNISAIKLDKPYAKVTIKKDKTTNINDVIISQKVEKKAVDTAKKVKPFNYKINQFNIVQGESDFSDYSLLLPFVVHLNGLEGEIKKISSNKKSKTDVVLNGKAFDLSPVEVKGFFNSEFDDFDIEMLFDSLPLPFISPYMVEFSGDKIEKGKMNLALRYKVNNRKLTATNSLVIDQFELGEKVENPDAVQLPLDLAAVLLRDKDGRININMPLEGSLDDPEFSVGTLIVDVFVNLITKVAASPFTAIGSFLDSDDDFSVITFAPGSAFIDADQSKKLDGLATALSSKSELSLEVRGEAYINQDWPVMNEAALTEQLKQIYAEELKKSGKAKRVEYIQLSEEDYQRLLADLFIKTYPDLAERSFFGKPQLIYPDMGEFYAVAKNMLQGMIAPDTNELHVLALARARNIARYMVETGNIDHSRIFVLDGKVTAEAENKVVNSNLILKVQ